MINYKNTVKQLKSCVFTCINPQLASEASIIIQLLAEQLCMAEQCISAVKYALDKTGDNDWAIEAIREYEDYKNRL